MKNERISELFSANLDRLYAAAKEKHGERAEEALVNAVRKTAGKFKKLGEKAYVTALLQELGASAFYEGAEPAPEGLASAIESAFAEDFANAKKKGRLFAILGGAAAVVCVAVAIGFALQPDHTPAGVITIDGSKELTSGDFVLSNVHTINDYTGFDGEFDLHLNAESKHLAASTVAPDGTVYLLAVCASNSDTETDTIGLYQMTPKGWKKICLFDQKYAVKHEKTHDLKYATRNFVFCDAESSPVVFLYDPIDEQLIAYSKNGKEFAAVKVSVRSPRTGDLTNIVASADENSVHFACSDGSGMVDFLIFDFTSCEFRQSDASMTGGSLLLSAIENKGDHTYLLVMDSSFAGGDTVYLYGYKGYAEDTQEKIFEKQLYAGGFSIWSNPADSGSLFVDDTGKVYAFFSVLEDQMDFSSTKHMLEIVSADGENLVAKQYASLIKSKSENRGIFMAADGSLYFIETGAHQLSVGTFAGADYAKIREVASFKHLDASGFLKTQYMSVDMLQNSIFVNILSFLQDDVTSIQHGFMYLQFK